MMPVPPQVVRPHTEDRVAGAQEAARVGDADKLKAHIDGIIALNRCGPLPALDMTTDRDGNTLLHLAAVHGNTLCMYVIWLYFAEWNGRLRERKHLFAAQPNNEQNTAIHLAARHENPDVFRTVYSLFCCGRLFGLRSCGHEPAQDATDRFDEEESGPPLRLLKIKNAAGRDAAAEARAFGREENVEWCEHRLSHLDPGGNHQSPEELKRLSEYANVLLGITDMQV